MSGREPRPRAAVAECTVLLPLRCCHCTAQCSMFCSFVFFVCLLVVLQAAAVAAQQPSAVSAVNSCPRVPWMSGASRRLQRRRRRRRNSQYSVLLVPLSLSLSLSLLPQLTHAKKKEDEKREEKKKKHRRSVGPVAWVQLYLCFHAMINSSTIKLFCFFLPMQNRLQNHLDHCSLSLIGLAVDCMKQQNRRVFSRLPWSQPSVEGGESKYYCIRSLVSVCFFNFCFPLGTSFVWFVTFCEAFLAPSQDTFLETPAEVSISIYLSSHW